MKHDILEDIIAHKQIELQHQKKAVPLQTLLGLASEAMDRNTVSMRESLENSTCGIIAEFKRKSPSKGPRQRFQISFRRIRPMKQQPAPS